MRASTLAALVAYDGSHFHGYQRQGALPTVEAALRAAIERASGSAPRGLVPAGRTDAGVHAIGQVISFRLAGAQPPGSLRPLINAALPPSVYLRDLWHPPPRFNARAQALGKRYRYAIDTRGGADRAGEACLRDPRPLDVEQMRAAAALLLGEHDFSSFRASGCGARSPICRLQLLRLASCGPFVVIDLEGDRFLRRMARNLVGWLMAVGVAERAAAETSAVLAARTRAAAGPTAPARGLTLLYVRYAAEVGSLRGAGSGSARSS